MPGSHTGQTAWNTAQIPRLHRQRGLSTPPSARRNARSSTPAPHPRPWANKTNRIQNVLTRGTTTFTDGRTSTGRCDYPVLPSANSRHMTSTGTHDPSLPTHDIHNQHMTYMTAQLHQPMNRTSCWRRSLPWRQPSGANTREPIRSQHQGANTKVGWLLAPRDARDLRQQLDTR